MNARELKKYGSRKFLLCAAALTYSAIGNWLDKVESKDFAWIISIIVAAYTSYNYLSEKAKSSGHAIDTGGSS